MIIYRMVIVEGHCTKLTSSSLHTYIGWHKSIVSSDWSDTMVWFGQILLLLSFTILYIWSLVLIVWWLNFIIARMLFYQWLQRTMAGKDKSRSTTYRNMSRLDLCNWLLGNPVPSNRIIISMLQLITNKTSVAALLAWSQQSSLWGWDWKLNHPLIFEVKGKNINCTDLAGVCGTGEGDDENKIIVFPSDNSLEASAECEPADASTALSVSRRKNSFWQYFWCNAGNVCCWWWWLCVADQVQWFWWRDSAKFVN